MNIVSLLRANWFLHMYCIYLPDNASPFSHSYVDDKLDSDCFVMMLYQTVRRTYIDIRRLNETTSLATTRIRQLQLSDVGQYTCTAVNQYGTASVHFVVTGQFQFIKSTMVSYLKFVFTIGVL